MCQWRIPHTLEKLRECKTLEEINFVMKDLQEPYGIREVRHVAQQDCVPGIVDMVGTVILMPPLL